MSLRKWLFPYTSSLEEQLKEVKVERDNLLNRLLHAYSGYELRQPVPSYADAQAAVTKPPTEDQVLGKGTHATIDLMKEYESACLRADAETSDVTVESDRLRVQEEFQKHAQEYEERLMKARTAAAANSGIKEL